LSNSAIRGYGNTKHDEKPFFQGATYPDFTSSAYPLRIDSKKNSILLKQTNMKKSMLILQLSLALLLFSSYQQKEAPTFQLKVKVNDLRNSKGEVLFVLYNRSDAFPEETYAKYYRKLSAKIVRGSSEVIFEHLPAGKYAINVLHDEDANGRIRKGLILPKEGIGFSNYGSIGISNRPNFQKASFELKENTEINVKMIYF
jgi:uncharacterized protein (DUF2141 family)